MDPERRSEPESDTTSRPSTIPLSRTGDAQAGTRAELAYDGTPEIRYAKRGELGQGGMGDVGVFEDRRTGRDVAMKVVRNPALRERFLHEARIQAQLEHPSIVPVYDVGLDAEGVPYFTMKRILGVTLADVLQDLRRGDAHAGATHTRRRLLTAVATVCMTVHYAHTRNVLHRDLKPSNIMLGEFGEIYVLDWGVASVQAPSIDEPAHLALHTDAHTAPGAVVGTPGFIAPERLLGQEYDARADVYAIGAILFAVLALEPLHPSNRQEAERSTLDDVDARPSRRPRGHDIPPELDLICCRATARDPVNRYASALALHDAIDRYLEGDRDLERRRTLSVEHATAAEDLVSLAPKAAEAAAESALRARAMSEASQALAFDPDNAAARGALMRLMTERPQFLPPEAREQLERSQHVQRQAVARNGAWIFWLGCVIIAMFAATIGFRAQWYAVVLGALCALAGGSLWRLSITTYEKWTGSYFTIVTTTTAIAWVSGLCGPFFTVPTLLMANLVGFLMQPERNRRPIVLGLTCAAVIVGLVVEWVGIVPPSYVFSNGTMIVENRVMDLTPRAVFGVMGASFVILTLAIGLFFIRFRDALSDAEERLHLHTWYLQQLVPRTKGA